MLAFSAKMYIDAKLSKKRKHYQSLLEKHPAKKKLYCITLPVNTENMMDIYCSREFWYDYVSAKELTVIGMAETKEKACKLAAQICLDILQRKGDISPALVREYFMG